MPNLEYAKHASNLMVEAAPIATDQATRASACSRIGRMSNGKKCSTIVRAGSGRSPVTQLVNGLPMYCGLP